MDRDLLLIGRRFIVVGSNGVYLWPLHVSSSKKIYLVEFGGREFLLVCGEDDVFRRYLWYSGCSRLVPAPYVVFLGRGVFLLERISGRHVGDLVYEYLHNEDTGKLIGLLDRVGRFAALLHRDLGSCNGLSRPSSWRKVLEERCALALGEASSEIWKIINEVCMRVLENMREETSSGPGHGDLHLHQIIDTGRCLYFIDPGGEPDTATIPGLEYDLAALVRSLEYVYESVKLLHEPETPLVNYVEVLLRSYIGEARDFSWRNFYYAYIARLLYEYYYERHYKTGLEWIPEYRIYQIHSSVLE